MRLGPVQTGMPSLVGGTVCFLFLSEKGEKGVNNNAVIPTTINDDKAIQIHVVIGKSMKPYPSGVVIVNSTSNVVQNRKCFNANLLLRSTRGTFFAVAVAVAVVSFFLSCENLLCGCIGQRYGGGTFHFLVDPFLKTPLPQKDVFSGFPSFCAVLSFGDVTMRHSTNFRLKSSFS